MCDPVTCEKCRNVAGCKEAEAEAVTMSGLIDNTARQIEQLTLLKSRQDIVAEGLKGPAEHPLMEEIRRLKEELANVKDVRDSVAAINRDLMANNRLLKDTLQALHSISGVWL